MAKRITWTLAAWEDYQQKIWGKTRLTIPTSNPSQEQSGSHSISVLFLSSLALIVLGLGMERHFNLPGAWLDFLRRVAYVIGKYLNPDKLCDIFAEGLRKMNRNVVLDYFPGCSKQSRGTTR